MRKLLNTLYVMTESCYLTLDGENIVIIDDEKTLGRFRSEEHTSELQSLR